MKRPFVGPPVLLRRLLLEGHAPPAPDWHARWNHLESRDVVEHHRRRRRRLCHLLRVGPGRYARGRLVGCFHLEGIQDCPSGHVLFWRRCSPLSWSGSRSSSWRGWPKAALTTPNAQLQGEADRGMDRRTTGSMSGLLLHLSTTLRWESEVRARFRTPPASAAASRR